VEGAEIAANYAELMSELKYDKGNKLWADQVSSAVRTFLDLTLAGSQAWAEYSIGTALNGVDGSGE
jgi:hypothetical protein